MNEQETRFHLIDPVLRGKGYDDHAWLKCETPAPVEPIGDRGSRRRGTGRADYLLCVQCQDMPNPLPVAVIEAKAEDGEPLKGMQQARGYADCIRYAVRRVFATADRRRPPRHAQLVGATRAGCMMRALRSCGDMR